jgi:RNA polymerase sigma-70 factor (ECF subfamily)
MSEQNPDWQSFPTTHWSLVAIAGQGSNEAKRYALAELIKRYLPALKSHLVYRKRMRPEDAEDLLQGFLSNKVIEQGLIERADRQKGKFRTFLLTALDRFATDQIRHDAAKKRCPEELSSLQEDPGLIAPGLAPEVFDVAWARQLLNHAVQRMQQHCKASKRLDIWCIFEARILGPTRDGVEEEPYGSLAKRLGFVSPSQASNALITAKRTFARILRSLIGEYEKSEEHIEAELRDLREILSSAR